MAVADSAASKNNAVRVSVFHLIKAVLILANLLIFLKYYTFCPTILSRIVGDWNPIVNFYV